VHRFSAGAFNLGEPLFKSALAWGGLCVGWLHAPAGGSMAAHLLRTEHTQLRRWCNQQLAAARTTHLRQHQS
jgi:hypothetical protein